MHRSTLGVPPTKWSHALINQEAKGRIFKILRNFQKERKDFGDVEIDVPKKKER